MEKLYCYVDETGQDTKGALFSVCCVVTLSFENKEQLENLLKTIEAESRKKSKWQKTDNKIKHSFLTALTAHCEKLKGHIYIQHFYHITDFMQATVEAIARSINATAQVNVSAIIYIDGLPRSLVPNVAVHLRRYGILTEKVGGLKDEQSALIRLADATAGFVRDYLEGEDYAKPYFRKLLAEGVIIEI